MQSRPVPLAATSTLCALLVVTAVMLTAQGLALAADGSYYLVRALEAGAVFGPELRVFANAARQLPVLAPAWLGVTDMHVLSIAHGVGQLVLPAVVWAAAAVLARHDRLVFAAVGTTAALCAGATWLFSVSENVLAVPLTVLVAVLLWLPSPWRARHAILGVAASVVLVASYETALLTGLVLALWAAWRARRELGPEDRYGCVLVAIASVASIVGAIVGASGAGPGPRHAQSFLFFVISLEPWPLYLAFAGLALVVAAFELGSTRRTQFVLAAAGLATLTVGVIGTEASTSAAYEARGGASAASVALMLYLWWRSARGRPRGADAPAWIALLPIAAMLGSAAILLDAGRAWADDLDAFREQVRARSGLVLADEVVPADRSGALWDWTAMYLSLTVRAEPDDAILIDRNPSYVPIAPEDGRDVLPDEYVWRS